MCKKITNKNIIKTVENHFGLKFGSILSPKKSNRILAARQIAMYLSKELLNYSYCDIASIYSKDITTVLHNTSTVKSKMKSDSNFYNAIFAMKEKLI